MDAMRQPAVAIIVLLVALAFGASSTSALAHYERPVTFPSGSGAIPAYRSGGPHLLVCSADQAGFEQRIASFTPALQATNRALYADCLKSGFRDLQAAVDQVSAPGMTILVTPGVYREVPSLAALSIACSSLPARTTNSGYQVLSYEQQKACPHLQNLVAILGITNLQIEGTGAGPGDVVFDAQFAKLNVIRADRSNGIYLRNLTAERSTFNAVYVLEADGFVIDHVVGRWNDEYGFLSFAADHGLFTGCEAYGNGDSGIYPGGTSDINRASGFTVKRYAIEVTGCHSHHNTLGYSGTGGDSVWVHDNEFDSNTAGASMDSLFPDHPGLPQNHALFEHNLIHGNNTNYYGFVRDGTCARTHATRGIEKGVACPAVPVPVGAGILVIGGNYDLFRENWVYDNWRVGFVQVGVPGFIHGDNRISSIEETSNFNRYIDNHLGRTPTGVHLPNGFDYFWDGQGQGNCWRGTLATGGDPIALPTCPGGSPPRLLGDPNRLLVFADCSNYELATRTLPAGCNWWDTPGRPGSLASTLTVASAVPAIQLVAMAAVLVALVRRRRTRLETVACGTAAAACLLLLVGAEETFRVLAVMGVALLGLAWLMLGAVLRGRLAWLTLFLGVVALLEAVDGALVTLPIPFGVAWVRLVLEVAWFLAVVRLLLKAPARAA